ncbi:MAG TPA: mucoidy inhibitor MuiA family protein, partial [Anaerolineae bacterium]
VRELEEQIEQLQDEVRLLEDGKATWAAQAKVLDGLRQATAEYARGWSRGRIQVEDQAKLIHFLQNQDREVRAAVRDLEKQQRTLNERLQKLRQELKALQSARPRQRYQVRVDVEVLTDGTFRPAVSYVVRNAGWQPLYDVRLVEKDGRNGKGPDLEINTIAQVTQSTGQDWQHVQLVVSTARPALNQRLPELKPWYLDVYTPPQPLRAAPAPLATTAMLKAASVAEADEMVAAAPEAEVAADVAVAAIQDSGTTVNFVIDGETDIPGDGSPHKTVINQLRFEPKVDYLAVPRHTTAVYRRVTVNNSSGGPLLAGSASLFTGEEFIGRTHLEYTPAGGEIELLLGVEERMTVERELIKRDVDKRFLRDNRQLRYGYKIELENLLAVPADLEVHDHIPVSRHEQIKVKLEQVKPEPAEKSDLNLMEWRLSLPAGATQTIEYEYTVEHPRSLQIIGLTD